MKKQNNNQNIYLTGIMGSGKTSVGKLLASQLSWTFQDADNVIEATVGKTISRIFSEQGEQGFRKIEAEVISNISRAKQSVIALGGGVLEAPVNREKIQKTGTLVWLNVKPEVAAQRLIESENRPLIAEANSVEEISRELEAILKNRYDNYSSANIILELEYETIEEITELILNQTGERARLRSINTVDGEKSPEYPVYVDYGLIAQLDQILSEVDLSPTAALITDTNVQNLYGVQVEETLVEAGFNIHTFSVNPGEMSKNLDTMQELYDYFSEVGLDRKSPVIVLGGGVIGDMGGFFAASYLRGLPLIHVPTTLLAQVDSSIGGKVGVNLKAGKNLVGDFYNPRMVVADINTLFSLPGREWYTGLGEVIKYGLIGNPEIYDLLSRGEKSVRENIHRVVQRSIEQKLQIVNEDFTEGNIRRYLNFGHTLGHALEKVTNYSLLNHGEAVCWGILAAVYISHRKNLLGEKAFGEIIRIMEKFDFRIQLPDLDKEQVYQAVYYDKKRIRDEVHWVLLKNIGNPVIDTDVPEYIVLDAIDYAQNFVKKSYT